MKTNFNPVKLMPITRFKNSQRIRKIFYSLESTSLLLANIFLNGIASSYY
ncbi:hypothetical protein RhiirC2_777079 [Rhizophagus irregularis]|uniref:Uncharacterized protein n=1 Tax=Rhizophagus irregularis TaxID=588596 RepID=A0A2N1NFB4_9GLOM|nr:hypothetical protein RhiirC2_777079 [Rhizophagus irregularis]